MKNILTFLTIIFLSMSVCGQEYNRWAADIEIGGNRVNDEQASNVNNTGLHLGLGLRYNLNETFGVGLTGGLDYKDLFDGTVDEERFDYGRINAEAYLDALNLLDLNNQLFTVLLHGGPGLSFINSGKSNETNEHYKNTIMNVRGGVTALFKISNRFAIKGDFSTTANLNQSMTLDGSMRVSNTGVTSTLHNFSAGLVYYFGKKDKDDKVRPHADWYEKPSIPTVNNITNPVTIVHKNTVIEKSCDCDVPFSFSEYVFFGHDEDVPSNTNGQAYKNVIFKVFKALVDNPDASLTIKGFASPTSSSDEYNMDLSRRRAKELKSKFVAMGVSEDRIKFKYFGKDKKYEARLVHDVARRVELYVK